MTACHCPCVTVWTAISKSSLISVFFAEPRRAVPAHVERPLRQTHERHQDAVVALQHRVGRFAAFAADGHLPARLSRSLCRSDRKTSWTWASAARRQAVVQDRAAPGGPPASSPPGPTATAPAAHLQDHGLREFSGPCCAFTSPMAASSSARSSGWSANSTGIRFSASSRICRAVSVAALIVRLRLLEDAHQEVAGLLRLVGFLQRRLRFCCRRRAYFHTMPDSTPSAASASSTAAQQRRHRRSPPRPLDRPLHRPHRPRPDRLARLEPPQVVGQLRGAGVAPRRLLAAGTSGRSSPGPRHAPPPAATAAPARRVST